MRILGRGLLVATTALLLTALVAAQTDADQKFMSAAAQDGMAKIQMAYLALQNSQNAQVKALAQQILSNYGPAQDELIYIANQNSVLLPQNMDAKDYSTYQALSQLEGAAFDKAYVKAMMTDHTTDSPEFAQEKAKVNNQAIAAWANKTLPMLQDDVKDAKKVAPAVGIH